MLNVVTFSPKIPLELKGEAQTSADHQTAQIVAHIQINVSGLYHLANSKKIFSVCSKFLTFLSKVLFLEDSRGQQFTQQFNLADSFLFIYLSTVTFSDCYVAWPYIFSLIQAKSPIFYLKQISNGILFTFLCPIEDIKGWTRTSYIVLSRTVHKDIWDSTPELLICVFKSYPVWLGLKLLSIFTKY